MIFLFLFCGVLALIYFFLKQVYSHWERNGVPSIRPSIPFGNLGRVAKRKAAFGIAIYELYQQSKGAFVGIYLFFRPAILIRDAHLAKKIMTSEFTSFHDRGVYCNEEDDPLSGNLFALPGEKWKNLRTKLTPTFTSGKLKNMMPTIMDVGKRLENEMKLFADLNEPVEMWDLSARYVVDIIASVVFGMEVNTIKNPDNEFRAIGRSAASEGFLARLRPIATFICPKILEFLRIASLPPRIRNFVTGIVQTTIDYREKNNVTRKDFMQLLIDLRKEDATNSIKGMSVEQCAAQVFIFYIAGSETSTGMISFMLHEISQNPDILKKLQDDIDLTLDKHNGEVTYESIKDMKYLEFCFLEAMRKYPFPLLNRECTKDFKVPDSEMTIKKGTPIIISLLGISKDPNYFPDPEKFIPERFSEENKNYDENAYFPFGEGPRTCIGIRLAKVVVKVGLVLMLTKFNFAATQKKEMEFAVDAVGLRPLNGVVLRVSNREKF